MSSGWVVGAIAVWTLLQIGLLAEGWEDDDGEDR